MGISEKSCKFPYWGPFVLETAVEQEFVDMLLEKGNGSREKNLDHRKHLAGMIENEYHYEDYESWFIPKFSPYIDLYNDALVSNWITDLKTSKSWNIKSLWINYQKSNEYNPPHNHGGDLAFVIYLQVPKEIAEENKKTRHKHNNPGPGMINFIYGEGVPYCINHYSVLPSAKDIYIFPAWLTHFVDSFKSDVERISVSGNIRTNGD